MKNDIVIIGENKFSTLVAITAGEQSYGLMEKSWPPPIMTFAYSKPDLHKFWMKNTPSPLDILFVHNNKVIDICFGEPYSNSLIGPNKMTDLVIELPRGHVFKHDIKIGDNCNLQMSLKTLYKYIGLKKY